ncbi:MAG: serine/threonine-protein kinase [Xanthomonadales bacterium]|nr:serine/threonine-protein kinase [Xanthomonadales bacterium]
MAGDTTSLANSEPPQPISLKGYEFVRELGAGGAGSVWLAKQREPSREVAIKLIPIAPGDTRDFAQEANLQARLSHPNLVDVYQAGIADDHYYMVMPYLGGGTLQDRLAFGKLDTETTLRIGIQIAEALAYLHGEKLVHRDLKPGNILFDRHGNALLADFGIANQAEITGENTREGHVSGTPTYMSPEQIRCEPLDGRSDLYALGVVLYECVTGQPPFRAPNSHELMQRHITDQPPRLRDVPDSVAKVIEKLLQKDAQRRHGSAREVVRALEDAGTAGIFDAFKRKTVLRNSGIYIFAAWILLQVIDVLGDIWEFPGWTKQGLFVALIAGLPLVALLSWVAEISESGSGTGFSRLLGRRYRLALLSLVTGGVLLGGMLLIHAWPDEALRPELRSLLSRVEPDHVDEANFYHGLIGFAAPPEDDMFRFGRHYIEHGEGIVYDEFPAMDFSWVPTQDCGSWSPDCVRQLTSLPPAEDQQTQTLLRRYERLQEIESFSNVFRLGFADAVPSFQPLIYGARLKAQQIIHTAAREGPVAAWPMLESELRFHRRLLEEAETVIKKLIAGILIIQDVHAYSLLLELSPTLPALEPMNERERSMMLPLASEFLYWPESRDEWLVIFDGPIWRRVAFQLLPIKKNRGINAHGDYILRMVRASVLPNDELDAQYDDLAPPRPGLADLILNSALYALFGSETTGDLRVYLYRSRLSDMFINLANIKRRMLQQNVSRDELETWLEDLPPRLRHPFTGDAPSIVEGTLRFENPRGIYTPQPVRIVIDYPDIPEQQTRTESAEDPAITPP